MSRDLEPDPAEGTWRAFVLSLFDRIREDLRNSIEDLGAEQLEWRPSTDANPIGWMAWHLTRSHDRNISEMAEREQLWTSDGWHERFARPANASDTGFDHTSADVHGFECPSAETILQYHEAVFERARAYVESLTSEELERRASSPTLGEVLPVRVRLSGVLVEGFEHVGQIAYVRGLIVG